MDEAIKWAKVEKEQQKQIVKQALAEGREEIEKKKREWKDMHLSAEGKDCQRKAQIDILKGK